MLAKFKSYWTKIQSGMQAGAKTASKHWKIPAIIVALLLVLGGVVFAFIPAPSAQGAKRGHTVEIYRNAQIRIIFDQQMNKESVERAFQISPSVSGRFSWEGNQLIFTPDQDLTKGQTYEVTVDEQARNIWLKKLKEVYRQNFSVLDYPEVVVVSPVDQSTIMQDQVLTVLFDHPVRYLNMETDAAEMLVIEPVVKGTYKWLGTSGFEFIPDDEWPAATSFTVTVPKGTQTADGGSTIEDYTWTFQTPALASYLDTRDSAHNINEPVEISFNYPVDLQAVKEGLTIMESTNTVPVSQFDITFKEDDNQVVQIIRKGGFQLGYAYTFNLPIGFTADVGPLGLVNDWTSSIRTDEKGFKIKGICPGDGSTKDVYDSVVIAFNNPVDEDLLEKSITVTPELKGMSISTYGWSQDSACQVPYGEKRSISIHGSWDPSTQYTIHIKAPLADIYAQALENPQDAQITTNPYRPNADLSTYSKYGIMAAHLPRIYQLRTMNLSQQLQVQLCHGSIEDYMRSEDLDCSESYEQNVDPTTTLNEYKIIDLDLDQIADQKLPNGAYELNVTIPDFTDKWQRTQSRMLLITDTALTVKKDNEGNVLVWATDLQSGEPVVDLTVDVWSDFYAYQTSNDMRKLASGKTDSDGLVMLHINSDDIDHSLAVHAYNGTRLGFTSTNWDDGISPWNYNLELEYDNRKSQHIGYIYTDRRIYRPDQMVYFKGVVRKDTDAVLSLPEMKEIQVYIEDAEGTQIYSESLSVSEFGTFHGEAQLETSMPLGTFRIYTLIGSDADRGSISGQFDVREYRRPDFKVEVPSPQNVIADQVLDLPIHAEYYHGVPLKDAKVEYQVTRTTLYFQPMSGEWYNYSTDDQMYDCYWYCRYEKDFETVISGEGTLDDQGNLQLRIPTNLSDYETSASYSVKVTVTDINQRAISYQMDFPVHKGVFYLGIRSNYSSGWSSSQADFDLITINSDETIRTGVPATVKFYKRTWTNTKKEDIDGSTRWEWEHTDTLISTQSIVTGADGRAHVSFDAPEDGEYIAIAETNDPNGNTVKASVNRYIYSRSYSSVRVSDDHHLQIVQNQASYDVGDMASLAVQTPYTNTKALVTVERNSIRDYRVIDLGSDNRVIDVPIQNDSVPNIYVSVVAVQGGGSEGIPEFRMGYADLQVDTTSKILDLTVTPDKENYKPGEKVTLTINAKNPSGSAADAEVSIAVVDERVIALLGSIDKNILGKFWFPRNIGVTTAQTLTMLVKKVYFGTEGGAGGKGGEDTGPAIRGNFKDTAYWNATVQTGSDGKATVSFDLPDNLTSWDVLAIGTTKDTVVGSADASFITRRDLMVEPILPRILRYDDTAMLGAHVFNATDQAINVRVDMKADGLTLTNSASRQISLAPQERKDVYWQVRAPKQGTEARVTVTASGNGLEDGFVQTLPVLPYSVPETVSASGIFEKNMTETLEIPEDILTDMGNVTVSVQPNVGNGLQGGLDYLIQFPYGCTEQLTSAMIANMLYEELADLNVSDADQASLDQAHANVQSAMNKVLTYQRYDGGFGYWPESDYSYAHLTAYVFWGLSQAEKAGYEVDADAMDRTETYLRNYLAQPQTNEYYNYLSDSERAQVIFMLSERNTRDLESYADTLYERRDQLSHFARAFLAMAYNNIEKGSSSAKVSTLMGDLQNDVVYLNPSTAYVEAEEGYSWMMSSNMRSTSIYLQALLKIDPKHYNVEPLLRYLISNRVDGYWGTTQNTAMTLIGLVEYVRANPINEHASVVDLFLDNNLTDTLQFPEGDRSGQASQSFTISELVSKGLVHQIGLEKDSDTRWFYDVNMNVFKQIEDIEPFENGFTVIADVYGLDDKKNEEPLSEVPLGDNVRVHMKLLVPKERQYVALEYHLPAGLEAVDFTLKTSPQYLAGETQQCAPTYWGGQRCVADWEAGWWWENAWEHIEQRDDRVFLFADRLNPGIYEYDFIATAITPGTYRVPPTRVYEFYNPLANAHNEGKILTVTQ